jgi:hypothetical protein
LKLYGSSFSATIQLVSPLTKKIVSKNNGGGGNWGADNCGQLFAAKRQIKTFHNKKIKKENNHHLFQNTFQNT